MKSIKYLVVLACMTLGMANVAKAQVFNDEVMFFEKNQGNTIRIVRFVDGKLLTDVSEGWSKSKVENNLRSSSDYYNNYPKGIAIGYNHSVYVYDESLSTSSRIVYVKKVYGDQFCYAISSDLTSLIYFIINRDGRVNEGRKKYYIRVSKEDLLPKSVNPNDLDFLNE